MGLFKFNVKGSKPIDKIVRRIFQSYVMTGTINQIQNDADEYIEQGYQGNADIYSIIRRYVTMSTQAKLVLRQKQPDGKIIDITDHDLNKFLFEANPFQSMAQFREAYTIYMLSIGNSFWYKPSLKTGVNAGQTTQIFTLPANDMEIITKSEAIQTSEIRYKLQSGKSVFETNEIHHTKYFNPMFYSERTLYGQSPLQAASTILTKQNEAEITQAKQFNNQGPAYMMFRDSQDAWNSMSEPQKIELQKEINGLSAKGKQGSGIVLKDKFGVIKLGISASDLNILESTREGRRVLCNVYQLPVGLFNDPSGSTYNNISTARKAAWTDAIMPHNNMFATELTRFLISPVEDYVNARLFFDIDYSAVEELQAGIKEKVDWMVRSHWTANEIRQATGKDKIESPEMDEPVFAQGDILLSELDLDVNMENKNYGDYK